MRVAALALLLVGCPGTPAPSDAGADACWPSARVCVTGDGGGPATNATVTASRAGEIPFQGRTGDSGCVVLDLTAGDWALTATTPSMCTTAMPVTVSVVGCGRAEATLSADLCTG